MLCSKPFGDGPYASPGADQLGGTAHGQAWLRSPLMVGLRDELSIHMAERGITASVLARNCGVTDSQISRIMSEPERQPTLETLRKIAEGTGISMFRILLALGYTADELRGEDPRALSNESLLSLVRERMRPCPASDPAAPGAAGASDMAVAGGAATDLAVGSSAAVDGAAEREPESESESDGVS